MDEQTKARLEYLRAQVEAAKLEREQRELEAKQEAEEAERRAKQENAEARQRWLNKLEQEKQARRDEDAAKLAAWWTSTEADERARYLRAGGTEAEFRSVWPTIKARILADLVQYQDQAALRFVNADGRYDRF